MREEIQQLFSGTPLPENAPGGWKERQDALFQRDGKPMPPPWNWEIPDASAAILCGGGEDGIIASILHVGPCDSCRDKCEGAEWKWGGCGSPSLADAVLIRAAPDLLAAAAAAERVMPDGPEREEIRAAIARATTL